MILRAKVILFVAMLAACSNVDSTLTEVTAGSSGSSGVPSKPGRYVYSDFKIPVAFTFESENWTFGSAPGEHDWFGIGPGGHRGITVITGPLTVDEWIESVLAMDVEASEPKPVEVGGAPGMVISEVRLPVDATESDMLTLLDLGGTPWVLPYGWVDRVYVVDVDGSSVAFYVEATEAGFEDFAVLADEVIHSFEWNP
jgi:hypothetical protein